MDDLARFLAFERDLLIRISTRTEPFAWGTAYFDEDHRERYIANFLLVERDPPEPAALLNEADRVLGAAGYPHRMVVVQADDERYAPPFVAAGYRADRTLMMMLRRGPDRPADLEVEECSFAACRALTEEVYRREPDMTAELVSDFVAQHEAWSRAIPSRHFLARIDGAPVGQCELYQDGDVAQVEWVDTLEEYRGRGVARAVVLAAIQAARASGAAHIYIHADDNDWPKQLYGRLGFDPYARRWEFTREPPREVR